MRQILICNINKDKLSIVCIKEIILLNCHFNESKYRVQSIFLFIVTEQGFYLNIIFIQSSLL